MPKTDRLIHRFLSRPFPAIRCADGFLDMGPHPGCAEFADPTWHPCRRPATHLIKGYDLYGKIKERVCEDHAAIEPHPTIRVYRFRRI